VGVCVEFSLESQDNPILVLEDNCDFWPIDWISGFPKKSLHIVSLPVLCDGVLMMVRVCKLSLWQRTSKLNFSALSGGGCSLVQVKLLNILMLAI